MGREDFFPVPKAQSYVIARLRIALSGWLTLLVTDLHDLHHVSNLLIHQMLTIVASKQD